jgi:hypothetical protein
MKPIMTRLAQTPFFFNQCFDKGRLKAFILWSYSHNGGAATAAIIEKMKDDGFCFATQAGISIGLDDLQLPPQKAVFVSRAQMAVRITHRKCREGKVTDVERAQQIVDMWHRMSERLRQDVVDHFRATDILNPVYMMAFSGARGNISQVRQLTAMRGLMSDPEGRVIGFPIRSSFREGLTLTEYMISCYGARKGLVDTALRTADAGYLTRRLVDVAHHVVVKGVICGTRQGIFLKKIESGGKILVPLQDRLLGRVLAADIPFSPKLRGDKVAKSFLGRRNQVISDNLAMELASQCSQVLVRSPLKCLLPSGVCQFCYGWNLSLRSLVTVGDAVGIIAGQSIGEPGTQLTMRTFHTGGVFSGQLVEEIRAPHPGIIHFPTPLQGLLIRASNGRVAFLVKAEGDCFLEELDPLLSSPSVSPKVRPKGERKKDRFFPPTSVDGETFIEKKGRGGRLRLTNKTRLPMEAATILYVRQGDRLLQDDLIAQSASLEAEVNETVEGIRFIFSQIAGQVASTQMRNEDDQTNERMSDSFPASKKKNILSLQSIWVLAGTKLPLGHPEWLQTRLLDSRPFLKETGAQRLEKSVRLLPYRVGAIEPLLDIERASVRKRRFRKDRTMEVSLTTLYDLHRDGGHLIDERSLLAEVIYTNRSTLAAQSERSEPLLLQRGYAALPAINWQTLPLSSSKRGEPLSSNPQKRGKDRDTFTSIQKKLNGEMMRQPIGKKYSSSPSSSFSPSALLKVMERDAGATLLTGDCVTFSTGSQRPIVTVGQLLRAGQEIASRLGTPITGQVIGVGKGEVTLRRAESILAYAKARFYADVGDWIQGNTPIVALPYRQLLAGDIVQGIPKIEQLFEASKNKDRRTMQDGVQNRLKEIFREYEAVLPLKEAVTRSLDEIQDLLMEGITKVYLSQGVVLADKHLEIIIRQITSKVEITTPGTSGLFYGEQVSLDLLTKINRSLPRSATRPTYRPALVGISRAVLNSDSFLSAASFQETTRVLIRHASKGSIDYLRGLKQHVIIGDLIPAGTGLYHSNR